MDAVVNALTVVCVALVTVGVTLAAVRARGWAEDRAREQRYADEWVRRHREGE